MDSKNILTICITTIVALIIIGLTISSIYGPVKPPMTAEQMCASGYDARNTIFCYELVKNKNINKE